MARQEIVLGTNSGTFWTGETGGPWLTDPRAARVFTSPRDAWRAALELQETQVEYLEGAAVELHIRDPEAPRSTRWVTSTAHAANRSSLRAHWRQGFGEALPPDLPPPTAAQDRTSRLPEYLHDVDWSGVRSRHGNDLNRTVDLGFDPAFRIALADLSRRDPAAVQDLWQRYVPADIPKDLLDQLVREDEGPAPSMPPTPSRMPGALKVSDRALEANEISRARDRETDEMPLAALAQMQERPGPADSDTRQSPPLPAFVRRHFVRTGDRFYYRQTPERLAFTAREETFRAEDVSVSVATAMVELAESRGWSALRVKGSKEFRRLVWVAAAKRGLSVDGYSPSAGERATLEQEFEPLSGARDAERTESRTDWRERDRPIDPLAGVLVEHGPAPFQHQQGNSRSYFVSLRDGSGEVATHWGLDLERALGESGAELGDWVQLARLGKKRVQVREPVRNDAGFVIDYETKETERNAWSVTVRERNSLGRVTEGADPLAAQVVKLFTSKRLSMLPPEEQARFRELYNQAKARLEQGDRVQATTEPSSNEISRQRNRERGAWGR